MTGCATGVFCVRREQPSSFQSDCCTHTEIAEWRMWLALESYLSPLVIADKNAPERRSQHEKLLSHGVMPAWIHGRSELSVLEHNSEFSVYNVMPRTLSPGVHVHFQGCFDFAIVNTTNGLSTDLAGVLTGDLLPVGQDLVRAVHVVSTVVRQVLAHSCLANAP